MTQPNGIHHIAIMSADIRKHVEFFSTVMGCPLVALFEMHGVPGGLHAFLRLEHGCYFSIVQLPAAAGIPIEIGRTHSGTGANACAPGALQHVAFAVSSETALLSMRDRIRSHGVNVVGPLNHGFCKSLYFAGPDHLTLEIALSVKTIDPAQWIDPATLAAAGISSEEAEGYKAPAPYTGRPNVAQPPYDPNKPHQAYPLDVYMAMLAKPDDVVGAQDAYSHPPVPP
jgi:catechol 2,3-dioxygenase-like lactoylglutathione lyase family enzyme